MINKKRGFKRVADTLSVGLAGYCILCLLAILFFDAESPHQKAKAIEASWALVASLVVPQALFYLVNYIIEGFTKAPE